MKQNPLASTIFSSLLAWSANFEVVQERGNKALHAGQYKQAEAIYSDFLKNASPDDIGYAQTQLAIAYYKDQEHEKAFKTFLEALENVKVGEPIELSDEEASLYEAALKIYLDHAGLTPDETAQKIAAQFGQIYEKKPEFYRLGYILAVGKANLGLYDQFFDEFYKVYIHHPQHFLAFKAKAALHIKLFDRAKTDAQRQEQRKGIISNAQQAALLQPDDSSLYRMILAFTPDESKAAVLSTYLNKIIDQNIVVSRIDVPYYVEIAIAFDQYELAQKFLNKAREWYAYSRVINVAQGHLDEKVKKETNGK